MKSRSNTATALKCQASVEHRGKGRLREHAPLRLGVRPHCSTARRECQHRCCHPTARVEQNTLYFNVSRADHAPRMNLADADEVSVTCPSTMVYGPNEKRG